MLLMATLCITDCLTRFVSAQVNKLPHATSTRIYETIADHGKEHSPLDGHSYKDSEAWD